VTTYTLLIHFGTDLSSADLGTSVQEFCHRHIGELALPRLLIIKSSFAV